MYSPAKQHVRRVVKELGIQDGLIYLLGQYAFTLEDSDMPKTWRQRRYFYYCSGVDVPNSCLTYNISEDKLTLYIPEIHPERVVWEGRPPTIKEAEEMFDVDSVRHNGQLFGDLQDWQRTYVHDTLYILHKDQIPDLDLGAVNVDNEKLLPAIDRCRVVKDEYEIEQIRKANAISASAHRAVLRNIRTFKNEADIHGLFVNVSISHGQAKQAYNPIAGSGENAGVLHYSKNDEPLKNRQLVCLDAGAAHGKYASDVTRTFPISGYLSKEASDIYSLVEMMQESCIEALKPGVKMIDLHIHCHKLVAQGLLNLGIFHNGFVEDILKAGTTRGFYPHGLGHHVGLETHDTNGIPIMRYGKSYKSLFQTPALNLLSSDEQPKLEEGMVITIEPGVYFNRYELNRAYLKEPKHARYINEDVLERYWAVGGVRIEDNLLITADGYANLTTAPKGEEALKLIRAGLERPGDS